MSDTLPKLKCWRDFCVSNNDKDEHGKLVKDTGNGLKNVSMF